MLCYKTQKMEKYYIYTYTLSLIVYMDLFYTIYINIIKYPNRCIHYKKTKIN